MATITESNPTKAFLDTLIPFNLDKFETFVTENPDDVDWQLVSDFKDLDERFAEKFWDRLDWDIVSERNDLSISFVDHFKWMLNWEIITMNFPISIRFANAFDDHLIWDYMIGNPYITEEFIVTYRNRWTEEQWDEISEYVCLSEDFIRAHQHLVNWWHISTEQTLSSDFIREFKDKVDWMSIAYYQTIDKSLFLEFKDRIDWVTMSIGGKTSFELTLTELIDAHKEIYQSIVEFIENGKKNPLCCPTCAISAPVHKKHFKPIKKMGGQISLMNISADFIQYHWKRSISNPAYKLCRTVLTRDFEELTRELTNK